MSQSTRRSVPDDPNGSKEIDYSALHGKRVRVTIECDRPPYERWREGTLIWHVDGYPDVCALDSLRLPNYIVKDRILSIEEVEE